jgi:hypothetical protein
MNDAYDDDWGAHLTAPMDVHHPPLEYELPRRLAALRDGTADAKPNPQVAERRREEIALIESQLSAARDNLADIDRLLVHVRSAPVLRAGTMTWAEGAILKRKSQIIAGIDHGTYMLGILRARQS